MIRYTLLVFMAFLCLSTIAQYNEPESFSFEVSKPYKVVDAESKRYFYQDNHVLSIKIQKKFIIVQKFDTETMKEVYNKRLTLPKSEIENVVRLGDHFLVLYSVYNRSNESEQVFYREINFERGTWLGQAERIIATEGKVGGDIAQAHPFWGGFTKTNKFEFNFSKDSTKMMVEYRMVPEIKNDSKSFDKIGYLVLDENLKIVFDDIVTMPYTEKKMENLDFAVDSEGNTYVLAKIYKDDSGRERAKGSDESNYNIELLKYDIKAGKLTSALVEIDGQYINKGWLQESPTGDMICTGLYTRTATSKAADGLFYAKLGANGRMYGFHSYEIPVEVLNQYVTKRKRKSNEKKDDKGEAEFEFLYLNKLVFQADGSVLFLGEQFFWEENKSSVGVVTLTTRTYYYNSILVTKVSASGELEWMVKLPKAQQGTQNPGALSFKHIKRNDQHYFLYIDNARNLNLPNDQAPRTHVDNTFGLLTTFVVDDKTGDMSQQSILDMKDANGTKLYQFSPSRLLQIGKDEFLFEAYKKDEQDVLVKIRLKS